MAVILLGLQLHRLVSFRLALLWRRNLLGGALSSNGKNEFLPCFEGRGNLMAIITAALRGLPFFVG